MVFTRIANLFREPQLPPGPINLPEYFPVNPIGCETKTEALFQCLAGDATTKLRDMEKGGVSPRYYADMNENYVEQLKNVDAAAAAAAAGGDEAAAQKNDGGGPVEDVRRLTPDDDPLEPCRSLIAQYKYCCDRQLKKRQNWKLTEPYRVQEEYRYSEQTTTKEGEE
mmetsp:Transcript_38204/g.46610  ORF Transcript_38204/g.46610 Transcript_38204/m.46610 type:complete len:167 (+) Transcript_38204:140-640(+)|eukprot:CAMPEP_0172484392 /NCGR_PEP_ID=MMETSP1066-20121228/11851_1 /TAXON_ID=671091 /ORGANISM="Coscinodiscus wailesii, Strain CCMP2513" /LENGTH=166 /DNA_ID=CAMNT_0013248887 /DNA_START=139 /DNA_END=639 /DNA_ORIENTATION=+